jgi:predicted RND superfamily exporter protein
MIEQLLARASRLALRRPRLLLASMILPALLSVYAPMVPLDFSFSGLMDRSHPEVQRYFRASQRYGLGGLLPLLLEGPETKLDDAVALLEPALAELDVVRSVAGRPPREGVRLLIIQMQNDPFELPLDADDFQRIRGRARELLAPLGIRAHFAGMPAIVTQEQEATLARMRVLGPIALAAVLLLLGGIERRPLALAGIGLAMLLSVGVTLALVGLFAGELTIMESVFGIMILGLGVDFAIHLMVRLREEQSGGRDFAESLERAVRGTGRGMVTGAVTTAGAFLLLALAPDPVFYRIGLAGGIGLLLCLVFLIVTLPAVWVLLEPRWPARAGFTCAIGTSAPAALARLATRRPWAVLLVSALLLAWSAAALPRFHYETNLERVFSREIEAVDTARRIHALFGVDPSPWLVATGSVDEARRVSRAFESSPLFARSESVAFLQPEELASLPPSLSARSIGRQGELLVYAYAREPSLDSADAARERRAAQAIDPEATSIVALFEALIGTDRPWMLPLTLGVALFVALVLLVDLRGPRLALLAVVPVLAGSFVTLGILDWAGFAFNTVTLVGVPLLLGLGVDDGIHVVHRMLEEPERPLDEVVGSVGRGIAMTTATTCASVATLLFTRHPGIESIAILLLVGLPLCLFASVTLLPACATLMRAHAGPLR